MRKSNIVVLITTILLIPLLATSAAADEITATRDISTETVEPGDVFTVTIVLTALADIQAPALDENVPAGWAVTLVDDCSGKYKDTTTEFIWIDELSTDENFTVIYDVTVPIDAALGDYDITGEVSAYQIGPYVTSGDNTVAVIGDPAPDDPVPDDPVPDDPVPDDPVPDDPVPDDPVPDDPAPDDPAPEEEEPTEEPTEIPEFPIIAIPVMAILGMMFLLSRRK
ncbi:MAG: PEF-CTERM sorting domain-containing protein [Methanosarcinales archaeon]|nr:PEF-CTERM sorting domain-containing protein [Methanosarcinales archaeon]